MRLFRQNQGKPKPVVHFAEPEVQRSVPNGSAISPLPRNPVVNPLPRANEEKTQSSNTADIQRQKTTALAATLGFIASIGGFMFGFESGQISGFLAMSDFLDRFGDRRHGNYIAFSPVRQGTIVGLLCIGTLIGCLASGYICDKIGRRYTISAAAFFYIVGVVIEITSDRGWVQFTMGRFTAGLGIGALSTSVPMYQSESVPKCIRGIMVSTYQMMITFGIWAAYMVNFGTATIPHSSAQWRISNGLSALWAVILGLGILLLPESPRFAYRAGRIEEARKNMARLNGYDSHDPRIDADIREIEFKLRAERDGGKHPWHEVFTGPRMLYRTILGMTLQAGQQLTGANFFFYYGTIIFRSTGISNSYVTSIILGSVNVGATIGGLWIIKNYGRRICLMTGAAWMFLCLMVYSFVGSYYIDPRNPSANAIAGKVLIVFTCLYIIAFATTWGPLVWTIVGELYPTRYRAVAMALATASNWLFNFLISFFTAFITHEIHYWYGLVFAGSCFVLFWIVYLCVIESKDRSLEEIDTMYIMRVNPRTSADWVPQKFSKEELRDTATGSGAAMAAVNAGKVAEPGAGEVAAAERVHAESRAPSTGDPCGLEQ